MQAAVANMTAQPDGTLLPNPNGGAVNGVEPYPLTYVEYAIAPAQPLLNSDCTANTAAQTAIERVADIPRQPGSDDLPAGMAPLPEQPRRPGDGRHRQGRGRRAGVHADRRGGLGLERGLCTSPSALRSSTAQSGLQRIGPAALRDVAYLASPTPPRLDVLEVEADKGNAGAPPTGSSRAAPLSLAAFGTVSADSWALPLLGILVLTLLLPGLVLLISGRSLSQVLGGLGPRRSLLCRRSAGPEGAET